MYRRVVSLFLLPCVLLPQTAALGHAHGVSQPAGHDLRPHFHTGPSSAPGQQAHGHHHHGPNGHHHDDDGDDGAPPEPLSDHDADAVFLPSVDVVLNKCPVLDNELTVSPFLAVNGSNVVAAIWVAPPSGSVNWAHPPPPVRYPCPLYVRHLALLI